ncbi:MAG: hypothetical protein KDA96_01420 [Planctomycetaceae bacterium]|nr:hypothetical protein [Planctomycetaceae bacterium]
MNVPDQLAVDLHRVDHRRGLNPAEDRPAEDREIREQGDAVHSELDHRIPVLVEIHGLLVVVRGVGHVLSPGPELRRAQDSSAQNLDHPDRDAPDRDHPDRDHPDRDHPDRDHPDRDAPDRDHLIPQVVFGMEGLQTAVRRVVHCRSGRMEDRMEVLLLVDG